jgi:hypothetical protein
VKHPSTFPGISIPKELIHQEKQAYGVWKEAAQECERRENAILARESLVGTSEIVVSLVMQTVGRCQSVTLLDVICARAPPLFPSTGLTVYC